MKILGKGPARPHGSRQGTRALCLEPVARMTSEGEVGDRCAGFEGYEVPQLTVIGDVRDLTTGSSSSGKKDANSNYYW